MSGAPDPILSGCIQREYQILREIKTMARGLGITNMKLNKIDGELRSIHHRLDLILLALGDEQLPERESAHEDSDPALAGP